MTSKSFFICIVLMQYIIHIKFNAMKRNLNPPMKRAPKA